MLALVMAISLSPIQGEINESYLVVETILSGLEAPTSMAFLGLDDMLIIEKNSGKVQRIVNGEMLEEPLLDLNVANQVERGLLGIAVSGNLSNKTYVFLYYTEADSETGEVGQAGNTKEGKSDNGDGGEPIGNQLYRYELSEDRTKLVNPKLILDLPGLPARLSLSIPMVLE
jgi:glucose/arabinose dehydrogenase